MTEVRTSPPPVFDFEKALLAKEETAKAGLLDTPNVRTAGNLWLCNSPVTRWGTVLSKLDKLRLIEKSASRPENPLPTIGWEVEIPRKPFTSNRSGMYAVFFDFIGLPRNRNHIHLTPGNPSTYSYSSSFQWEFSTDPAYSAAVLNRTLCELIKGGFIPHLVGPSTAQDRISLLDQKLVSLHINLGIPTDIFSMSGDKPFQQQEDIALLASSFEFAYTSPERFYHRQQSIIADCKIAELTTKSSSQDIQPYRLEIKALEVGKANTYRLMQEIQLVATSTFAAMHEDDSESPLGTIWQKAKTRIKTVYEKYYIKPAMIVDKMQAATMVRNRDVQRDLREIITSTAQQARQILTDQHFRY